MDEERRTWVPAQDAEMIENGGVVPKSDLKRMVDMGFNILEKFLENHLEQPLHLTPSPNRHVHNRILL
jgi:hypothetical protein